MFVYIIVHTITIKLWPAYLCVVLLLCPFSSEEYYIAFTLPPIACPAIHVTLSCPCYFGLLAQYLQKGYGQTTDIYTMDLVIIRAPARKITVVATFIYFLSPISIKYHQIHIFGANNETYHKSNHCGPAIDKQMTATCKIKFFKTYTTLSVSR